MDKAEFTRIKQQAEKFTHSSFFYAEFEELNDCALIADNDELILVQGENHENRSQQYLWAADSVDMLIPALAEEGPYLLTFVPRAWVSTLNAAGLKVRSIWHDYFRPNLDDIEEHPNIAFDFLSADETDAASEITLECRRQSRGFTGQTPDWLRQWLTNNDAVTHPAILTYRLPDGELAGILCTGLYGQDQKNGPIIWIREVAVRPAHQGKGIGRHLLTQALQYGKHHGARKAFLAVDEENTSAIHLYESMGFVASEEEGEINMVKAAI
ncbi:GNAT family N-acetyltransferase [Chloroflexota bacterium]|nr:GNAT family N-acetyltransferase [Chloroflexota bacterium]